MAHYRSALAQHREAGDEWMVGLTLNNLGLVYSDLKRWDDATAAFDEAHAIALRHENWMLENSVEVNRAELHIARGEWKEAAEASARALTLAVLRNDRQREAEALKFQGMIEREANDLEQAHGLLSEAEVLAVACDDLLLMAEVAREFGDLNRRLGQEDDARIAYARALDLFQAMGARYDYTETESRLTALARIG